MDDRARTMTDADDQDAPVEVPIRCADCGTDGTVPIDELAETLSRHNERLHDGEEAAEVDPAVAEELADLVAADLGLLEREG